MTNDHKKNTTLHAVQELSRTVCNLLMEEQQLQDKELARMCGLLHEAVVELSSCFSIMSDQLVAQSTKLKAQVSEQDKIQDTGNISTMLLTTQQMNSCITKAVVALQFEDILQQMIVHARQRVEKTQNLLKNLHSNIEKLEDEKYTDETDIMNLLNKCKADIEKTYEALTLSHPAQQQSMKKGDITLF